MQLLEFMRNDPKMFLMFMLFRVPIVLMSLILHECAHGYAALRSGDRTAQLSGRLSLNPLRHLDPLGTVFMMLFGFGWAKPVPVNPAYFRNGYRDDLKVSLAGVTVNFALFLLSAAGTAGLSAMMWNRELLAYMPNGFSTVRDYVTYGSEAYAWMLQGFISSNEEVRQVGALMTQCMQTPWLQYPVRFLMMSAGLNLGLAVFNLLPIPPLDGFHVVNDIFLKGRLHLSRTAFQITRLALFTLCFTGLFGRVLDAVMSALYGGLNALLLPLAGL